MTIQRGQEWGVTVGRPAELEVAAVVRVFLVYRQLFARLDKPIVVDVVLRATG